VNPEAWTEPLLARLAARLLPGGVWVSYSVQGRVRRALAAAGLRVAREPGPPGGKREMLRAEKPAA
jgi:tRNA U34 5-methylaminomethyl-2-thiouridine-forming methyltransferase MnmC